MNFDERLASFSSHALTKLRPAAVATEIAGRQPRTIPGPGSSPSEKSALLHALRLLPHTT